MKGLEEFLKRFTVIRDPSQEKTEIASIISAVIKADISKESIDVRKGAITIKAHPAIKGLIFINKEAILAEIKTKMPEKGISAIL